jgi:Glycosyltransferase family 87
MTESAVTTKSQPAPAVRILFCFAILVHALFFYSWITGSLDFLFVEAVKSDGQAGDFYGIYQAGANLLGGHSIYDSYDYLNEAPLHVPYYYFYRYLPPTAYVSAVGAKLFPPWPAYWLWLAVNELMIGLLVVSLLRSKRWAANRRWLIAALWLGFFPIYIEQWMGQFSISMALLLWLLWRSSDREPAPPIPAPPHPTGNAVVSTLKELIGAITQWRHYRWSADRFELSFSTLWAATITLKSFSVFLTWPYILEGRLKRILTAAAISIGVCLPYYIWRPADMVEFYRLNLGHLSPQIYMGAFGLQNSLRDFFVHLPGGFSKIQLQVGPESFYLTTLLLTLLSLTVVALAFWASLRFRRLPESGALNLALWLLVFLLVFKSIWEYHFIMVLPGLSALFLVRGSRFVYIMGLWLALPTLFFIAPLVCGESYAQSLNSWPGWFRLLFFSVKSLPTVCLFGWCLAIAAKPARWRQGLESGK